MPVQNRQAKMAVEQQEISLQEKHLSFVTRALLRKRKQVFFSRDQQTTNYSAYQQKNLGQISFVEDFSARIKLFLFLPVRKIVGFLKNTPFFNVT